MSDQTYDQWFYWGYDENGNLIPQDHGDLVERWTGNTKQTAYTLLAPNDWYVVREADNGTACPADIKTWRQSIRETCASKVTGIQATSTTDELAALIRDQAYSNWPAFPGTEATVE